jgi:antitoxin component YwqK of YwqJK toxin-antitoxin module
MNRLLIVPILLWAGLTAHEQTFSYAHNLFATKDAVDLSSSYNDFVADPGTGMAKENSESNAFRKKSIIKNGTYEGYYDNGELQFTTIVKKSRLQGVWKSFYQGGAVCDSGKFVKDVPDGEWKGWYPDGKLRYIWHFSASKYFSLKDEMMNQPKQKFFRISQLPLHEGIQYIRTDYIFGQATRTPAIMFRGKTLHQKNFDPALIKKRVDRNTTSHSYLPPFPECLFHGSFTSFYPDGRIREEGIFINGMRDGLWEEYARDGKKSRGSYHYGNKSGEWRTYDEKGKLLSYKRYNNSGVETGSYDFQASE